MSYKRVGGMMVIIGVCLILGSGLLVGYNLMDASRAEESVVRTMEELQEVLPAENSPGQADQSEVTVDTPYYVVNPEIEMPEKEIDGIPYVGVLEIPELALELPIISNWNKANARIAPCRYKGSAYLDDMIICAHNYKSHFGNLSTLSIGDCVLFTDMEGNQFRYQILEFEVMDGTAVEQMESGDWDLTLFTCTVGGKARLTARCRRTDK